MTEVPIHLLQSFAVYAKSNSMTKAAQMLGISQPALSKQLVQLSKLFAEPLFLNSGKRKLVTEFGQTLANQIHQQLDPLQSIIQETQLSFKSTKKSQIRIAARREILDRISGKLRSKAHLIFIESNDQEIADLVKSRTCQIGISHRTPDTHELIAKSFFREQFQLIIPKSLIKNPAKQIGPWLTEIPTLSYKEKDPLLLAVCENFRIHFADLQILRTTSNYESLAKMVMSHQGWSVLPTYLEFSPKDFWIYPLKSAHFEIRNFQIFYRTELAKEAWLKELIYDLERIIRKN